MWGRAAAGARSALKARRRQERLLGPERTAAAGGSSGDMCGGRGSVWLVLAAALLHGNRGAAPTALPRRTPGSRRGRAGWRVSRRAGEPAGGWSRVAAGLGGWAASGRGGRRPRSEARWALCFPSVPARRVPEEAVQGAGQELQPAGEAGGQRLAAAHRVLLPEPPADHGCGECGVALGPRTLLSRTGRRAGQDPPATCAWAPQTPGQSVPSWESVAGTSCVGHFRSSLERKLVQSYARTVYFSHLKAFLSR